MSDLPLSANATVQKTDEHNAAFGHAPYYERRFHTQLDKLKVDNPSAVTTEYSRLPASAIASEYLVQ